MTPPMPREVFRDLYKIGGHIDFNFGASKEECQKLLEQMRDFASKEQIEDFYQKTKSDKVNSFVDPAGLLQHKTGDVLPRPELASGKYLSRLVGGADLPQVVTGRWLQLAKHLNMPETPGDEPNRHLCACALHLALYSQLVEAGSEAHKKLFDKRVIDALAGFSSDSSKDHLDLLLQIEDIWFRNGSEDGLSFRTETGTYQQHGWVDGTSIKIDALSFDSIMMEHILVWKQRLSPEHPSRNIINLALVQNKKLPPKASDFDFDHPPKVTRHKDQGTRGGAQLAWIANGSVQAQKWVLAQLIEHTSGQVNLNPTEEKIEALAEKIGATPTELYNRLRFLSEVQRLINNGVPELKRQGQESEVSGVNWTPEVDDWLLAKTDEGITAVVLAAGLGLQTIDARIKSLEASKKTATTTAAASKNRTTTSKGNSAAESTHSPPAVRTTRSMSRLKKSSVEPGESSPPGSGDSSGRGASVDNGLQLLDDDDDSAYEPEASDPESAEESDPESDETSDSLVDEARPKGKAKGKGKAKAKAKAKANK